MISTNVVTEEWLPPYEDCVDHLRGKTVINHVSKPLRRLFAGMAMCSALAMTIATPSVSQEKKVTQTTGVDNTKMGAYRALAQLSFQAFQKGDSATAAELARILERTWDAAEEGGGKRSLISLNKDLFEQIDKAMDGYIKPVMQYAAKAPDPAAVEGAYTEFLTKLKQGD
jgi:hypothetical protein